MDQVMVVSQARLKTSGYVTIESPAHTQHHHLHRMMME
jgi:hypothetical protein